MTTRHACVVRHNDVVFLMANDHDFLAHDLPDLAIFGKNQEFPHINPFFNIRNLLIMDVERWFGMESGRAEGRVE